MPTVPQPDSCFTRIDKLGRVVRFELTSLVLAIRYPPLMARPLQDVKGFEPKDLNNEYSAY